MTAILAQKVAFRTWTHTEGRPGKNTDEEAVCKPRREASAETNPAHTLISDFSRAIENKFLVLKPPSLQYFVTAALRN